LKESRSRALVRRPNPHHNRAGLEHDPEKWEPVFHATNAKRVCAQIMLKQKDEVMMRFHLIAS